MTLTSYPSGYRLGPYRIERSLGYEQMAGVYLAHHTIIGQEVTLRVFRVTDTKVLDRAAPVLDRLNHPNIASIHFAGQIGGHFVIAIDSVEDATLRGMLLEKGRLDPSESLRILAGVVSALDYIHRLPATGSPGPAHLDLKPSNILLGQDGSIKVIDFRVAQLLAEVAPQVAQLLRSPAYMAPEHIRGQPSARSDVWAVGVIFMETLLGRIPGQGEFLPTSAFNPLDIDSVGEAEFASLPESCRAIVRRCLQPDPAARFASAGDLASALAAAASAVDLQKRLSSGTQMRPGENVATDHAVVEMRPPPSQKLQVQTSRTFGYADRFLLIAAGVILALAAVFWLWEGSRTSQNTPETVAVPAEPAAEEESRPVAAGGTQAASPGRSMAPVDYGAQIAQLTSSAKSHPQTEEEAYRTRKRIKALQQEGLRFKAAVELERKPESRISEKLLQWRDFLSRETTGFGRQYALVRARHWKQQLDAYTGYANLTVQSVRGLPAKDFNLLWVRLPDPFFVLQTGGQELGRSHTVKSSLSPVWHKRIRIYMSPGLKLYLELYDDNYFGGTLIFRQQLGPLPADGAFQVFKGKAVINLEIRRDR